jgi:hypothetical protein
MWGDGEIHTEFWLKSLKVSDMSEDLGVDGMIVLKWFLVK